MNKIKPLLSCKQKHDINVDTQSHSGIRRFKLELKYMYVSVADFPTRLVSIDYTYDTQ